MYAVESVCMLQAHELSPVCSVIIIYIYIFIYLKKKEKKRKKKK